MEQLMTIETFMNKLVDFTEDTLPSDLVDFEWMELEGRIYATVLIDTDAFAEGDE